MAAIIRDGERLAGQRWLRSGRVFLRQGRRGARAEGEAER